MQGKQKTVKLESNLARIDIALQMPFFHREANRLSQLGLPTGHQFHHDIAHRTVAVVVFRSAADENAA